jgi:uncharacterized protein (TIGR02145 family)
MNITNKNKPLLTLLIILMLSACVQKETIDKNTLDLKSKQIGQSEWTITSLNLKKFRNGDNIPLVSNCQEWYEAGKMKSPACCYLDFDSTNSELGLFYNWYVVNDPQKLAPEGWKVPSKKDLLTLVESLEGEEEAGKKLKSTSGWIGSQGENSSGLGFLPVGTILGANDTTDCSFSYKGEYTSFWSSTPVEFDYSYDHNLKAYGYFLTLSGWDGSAKIFSNPYKNKGCLVRLIKE